MAELTGSGSMSDEGGFAPSPAPQQSFSRPPRREGGGGGGSGGGYAQDVHSCTIHARQRTFYIDLKKSGNGMFLKVSEKSRGGQKTTIMFDSEDLPKFIEALQEMQTKL